MNSDRFGRRDIRLASIRTTNEITKNLRLNPCLKHYFIDINCNRSSNICPINQELPMIREDSFEICEMRNDFWVPVLEVKSTDMCFAKEMNSDQFDLAMLN